MDASVVVVLCALAAPQSDELKALVTAHEQGVALIRTVEVRWEMQRLSQPAGTPLGQPQEFFWLRDGMRERFRLVVNDMPPSAEGWPRGINEWTLDGKEYRQLRNWDPDKPQKLTPLNQGTLRAEIGPQTNVNPGILNPAYQFLLELDHDPRQTLSELIRAASQARYAGKGSVDGHETEVIEADGLAPATPNTKPFREHHEIHLDPAASYLVRKFVERVPKFEFIGEEPYSYCSVTKVVEFRDFGDGVFFPVKFQTESFRAPEPGPEGSAEKLGVVTVQSLKVNEPLAEDAFDLKFPRYAIVSHMPPVDGKIPIDVWGDDGPLRRITGGTKGLVEFEAELRSDPATAAELGDDPIRGPAYLGYALWSVAAAVAIAVLFLLWRRLARG